uniref:Uncharacterized protein n=1 Tax=Brassica oleracea var. oleracea TaxID=109376 RepID=A0A0D3BTD5_BRAOL
MKTNQLNRNLLVFLVVKNITKLATYSCKILIVLSHFVLCRSQQLLATCFLLTALVSSSFNRSN